MNDRAPPCEGPVALLMDYHERTKHRLDRYAAGPATLDWAAQPDPFRRWGWTVFFSLPRPAGQLETEWCDLAADRPAAPFNLNSLGGLLQLCAGITAWKEHAGERWSLRAHPSSGNLHPTETYVIARWVDGMADGLYHYQAREHSLEWRAGVGSSAEHPGLWLGFSSIHWREAWKYGERAFRYCQLDMGHVLAAVAYAAALHGWKPRLLPLDSGAVAAALGLDRSADFDGVEPEDPEAIVALHAPDGEPSPLPPAAWEEWSGSPSLLDPKPFYRWPVIEAAAQASRGIPAMGCPPPGTILPPPAPVVRAGAVLLGRRSAQAFDGQSVLPLAVFRRLLACLLPGGAPSWALWPHPPRVHPVLLVHRVEGLANGLYALPRSEAGLAGLRAAMRDSFAWEPADAGLPLYRLVTARSGKVARTISCHQDIASESAFSLMFVAEFAAPLGDNPAAYRHLHWEAGMLGHVATLEAEAAGWRGTGIGCFFDDADHEVLGLSDKRYQVLYHYAIGMPLDDPRITTLPAYD